MTTLDTNGIVLTGDNNYSGDYNFTTFGSFHVLGGANSGGQTDDDTGDGNEVFMFGNLQYKGTTFTENNFNDDTTHTYQSTATGTSNDTLAFHFALTHGTIGDTSNFLTDGSIPHGGFALDADNDATYQSTADANAWTTNYDAWQAQQPDGTTYTDSVTLETKVGGQNEKIITLDIQANEPSTPDALTADHVGNKTLLGFSVGSDHIALDGVGNGATGEANFDQFFNVTSTTHFSANHNVVNDTTITLTDGSGHDLTGATAWSVDLYGVDTHLLTTESDLQHFVWSQVTTNGQTV